MDELVLDAMARWPNVPAVHGWLRLDRRGNWMLVDRGRPGFDERLHGLGSPITSPQIVDFICRNYTCDERGRWFWQNGPQRVFVDLDVAPLVLRVLGSGTDARLVAHTGHPVSRVDAAWYSPEGDLILETDLGPGAIHDLDLAALALTEDEAPGDQAPGSAASGSCRLRLVIHGSSLEVQASPPPGASRFERRPRPAPESGQLSEARSSPPPAHGCGAPEAP
jgi:hypothetical protein